MANRKAGASKAGDVKAAAIADSAEGPSSERASSKLRHHAKLFRTTLASIQAFWKDASEEAKAEARSDLIEAAQDLDGFLQDDPQTV